MAHLTPLIFPIGLTVARGLFAGVMVLRERRRSARPKPPSNPTGSPIATGKPVSAGDPSADYRGNPAAHVALSTHAQLQRQELDEILAAHAAGERINPLRLAQLAGQLGRTPLGRDAVARAAAAGARGPTVADVQEVNLYWALQDPLDVVLTLGELCAAASSFRTSLEAQMALGGKIGGLLAMLNAEPYRFSEAADLAREVMAYAPPVDALGLQLWHRLAQLAAPGGAPDPDPAPGDGDHPDPGPERIELPLQFPEIAEQARRITEEQQRKERERKERERGIGHASPAADDEIPALPPPPVALPSSPPFAISERDAAVAMVVEDVRGGTKPNRPAMRAADLQVRTSVPAQVAAPPAPPKLPRAIFLVQSPARTPVPAPLIRVRAASEYLSQLDKPAIKLVVLFVLALVLASGCGAAAPLVERTAVWVAPGVYEVNLTLPGLHVQDAAQLLQADAAANAERLQCAAPRTEVAAAKETSKPGKAKEGEPPAPLGHTTLISGRLYCGGRSGGVS